MAPVGALTRIVPVGVVQVGCTDAEAVGAAIVGTALMVTEAAVDTHPLVVFLTVTLYAPGARPEKLVLAW